jgi:hypothetical protein
MKSEPIPEPKQELIEKCNADNQFDRFDRLFRNVLSVPKDKILKAESKAKQKTSTNRSSRSANAHTQGKPE